MYRALLRVAFLCAVAWPLVLPAERVDAAGPIVVESITAVPATVSTRDGNRGVDVTFTLVISGGRSPYTVRWTNGTSTALCENCTTLTTSTKNLRFAGDSFFAFFTIVDGDGQKATWLREDRTPMNEFTVGVGPQGLFTAPGTLPSQPGSVPTASAPTRPVNREPNRAPWMKNPDSGARFSGVTGQVEVREAGCEDEDCWHLADLDTMLTVGMHIRTQEESAALIGFSDMSTFVLKADSEVVVTTPPERESKIALVAGNIWVNVKNMAKTGRMDIEMNQAVAGIKGTTFVLSERGGTSTLQVIEGSVEFTSKASGQKATVTGGSAVAATKSGLGSPQPFDVKAVTAEWDAVRVRAERGTPAGGISAVVRTVLPGIGNTALLAGGGVALLALIALGAYLMTRRRSSTP